MKRIILLCSLAVLSFNFSFAQTPSNIQLFGSEASKFEANTSRNRTELYQTAYTKLESMMQQEITTNKTSLATVTGSDKTKLAGKIKLEEQYLSEIKLLATDKVKNRVAIKNKLDSFLQLL